MKIIKRLLFSLMMVAVTLPAFSSTKRESLIMPFDVTPLKLKHGDIEVIALVLSKKDLHEKKYKTNCSEKKRQRNINNDLRTAFKSSPQNIIVTEEDNVIVNYLEKYCCKNEIIMSHKPEKNVYTLEEILAYKKTGKLKNLLYIEKIRKIVSNNKTMDLHKVDKKLIIFIFTKDEKAKKGQVAKLQAENFKLMSIKEFYRGYRMQEIQTNLILAILEPIAYSLGCR